MKYKMESIKYVLTLFVVIICSTITYSQKIDSLKTNGSQKVVVNPDNKFNITLTNDSLLVTFKNNQLPISNIQELDDYLKNNLQNINQTKVILNNTIDTKYERLKSVMDILKKYKVTNFTHFVSNK